MSDAETIALHLTRSEALVLSALLHRWDGDGRLEAPATEAPERAALWNLAASLEQVLPELLAPDYSSLLAEARSELTPTDEAT